MMRCTLAIGNLLVLLVASGAYAQASTGGDETDQRIMFELGVGWDRQPSFHGERWVHRLQHAGGPTPVSSRAVLSTGISLRARLLAPPRGRGGLVVDLDLAARSLTFRNASSLWMERAGDPYVGLRVGHRTGGLVVRGGLGVTLPFGVLGDGPNEAALYERVGRRTFGLWEPWLLAPGTVAVVTRGDLSLDEGWITTGLEVAIAVLVPIASPPGLYTVVTQIGAWFGLRLGIVEVGLHGTSSALSSRYPSQDGVRTIGPFLRLRAGGLRVEARTLFAPLFEGNIPDLAAQVLVIAAWS